MAEDITNYISKPLLTEKIKFTPSGPQPYILSNVIPHPQSQNYISLWGGKTYTLSISSVLYFGLLTSKK